MSKKAQIDSLCLVKFYGFYFEKNSFDLAKLSGDASENMRHLFFQAGSIKKCMAAEDFVIPPKGIMDGQLLLGGRVCLCTSMLKHHTAQQIFEEGVGQECCCLTFGLLSSPSAFPFLTP